MPKALNKLELLEAGLAAPALEGANEIPEFCDDGCPPPKLNLNGDLSDTLAPLDSVALFSVDLPPNAVDGNKGLWEVLAVLNRLVAPLGVPKAGLLGGPETLLLEAVALGAVKPKPVGLNVDLVVAELLVPTSLLTFVPALGVNGVKEADEG